MGLTHTHTNTHTHNYISHFNLRPYIHKPQATLHNALFCFSHALLSHVAQTHLRPQIHKPRYSFTCKPCTAQSLCTKTPVTTHPQATLLSHMQPCTAQSLCTNTPVTTHPQATQLSHMQAMHLCPFTLHKRTCDHTPNRSRDEYTTWDPPMAPGMSPSTLHPQRQQR
jgi:hypothetical protein